MKKKIIGFFVCTLLIGATSIAVADWEEGDGHKMHFPQLPDPKGWDVDFGWWRLGDDWKCSKTGPVLDIHFWISWYHDDVYDIPFFKVSIYSNKPGPPWSQPDALLWSRTFQAGQFVIAGPWTGLQGWMFPNCNTEPNNHQLYFQVNIMDIEDPFIQEEGEIYWLVIDMPFDGVETVGWKTTYEDLHFEDYAVWEPEEPGNWEPICELVDLAFVITGEEEHCNLTIRNVYGGFLNTPQTFTVDAVLANTGTAPCVNVSWSFTFNGGIIISGPNNGVIPNIPPAGTATISSKLVIGLALPFLLPATVTVTATCPPSPAVTAINNVLAIILLCKVY